MLTKQGLFQLVRGSFLVAALGLVLMNPLRANTGTSRILDVGVDAAGAITITEEGNKDPGNIINIDSKQTVVWKVAKLTPTPKQTHLMVLFDPKHFFGSGTNPPQPNTQQTDDSGLITINGGAGTDDDDKYTVVVWTDTAPDTIYFKDPTIRVGSGSGIGIEFPSELLELHTILQRLGNIEGKLSNTLAK